MTRSQAHAEGIGNLLISLGHAEQAVIAFDRAGTDVNDRDSISVRRLVWRIKDMIVHASEIKCDDCRKVVAECQCWFAKEAPEVVI